MLIVAFALTLAFAYPKREEMLVSGDAFQGKIVTWSLGMIEPWLTEYSKLLPTGQWQRTETFQASRAYGAGILTLLMASVGALLADLQLAPGVKSSYPFAQAPVKTPWGPSFRVNVLLAWLSAVSLCVTFTALFMAVVVHAYGEGPPLAMALGQSLLFATFVIVAALLPGKIEADAPPRTVEKIYGRAVWWTGQQQLLCWWSYPFFKRVHRGLFCPRRLWLLFNQSLQVPASFPPSASMSGMSGHG
ncbi:MAG: hypothetical protein U0894_08015 [Pirellulales bacterium]